MADKYKIPFINACIRSMGRRFNLPTRNAYLYLKRFQGIGFLLEFFIDSIVESIRAELCRGLLSSRAESAFRA